MLDMSMPRRPVGQRASALVLSGALVLSTALFGVRASYSKMASTLIAVSLLLLTIDAIVVAGGLLIVRRAPSEAQPRAMRSARSRSCYSNRHGARSFLKYGSAPS